MRRAGAFFAHIQVESGDRLDMREFCVELTVTACEGATVYVRAESEERAKEQALAAAGKGNVVWRCQAVDDSTVEVLTVSPCPDAEFMQ
jgi:hypothetical protein